MTAEPERITDEDLHAFVDGVLPAARRAAVEAWLAATPDDAARVAAYRQQKEGLSALFDPVLGEPVPARLAPDAVRGGRRRVGVWLGRAAAAVLLAGAGFGGGWFASEAEFPRLPTLRALASEGVSAHRVYTVEVRHPVEVDASRQQHLVTWLSKRMGREIQAPDLSGHGFKLVGGRLLHADNQPACQFMYETDDGERLTLYIRINPDSRETAFRIVEQDGLTAHYWLHGALAFAVIGEIGRDRMERVAHTIYRVFES